MAVSTNHTVAQMQSGLSAYNFIKIPAPNGGSTANSAYSISAYPTFILIKPDKQIYDNDIWPIDNTILRSTVTTAGGTPQSCATAIEEPKQNTISVYPNPASKFILVESGTKTETQYEIYNFAGQKIKTGNINKTGQQLISTESLNEGQYFIRIYSDNKILGIQKFVVIKE